MTQYYTGKDLDKILHECGYVYITKSKDPKLNELVVYYFIDKNVGYRSIQYGHSPFYYEYNSAEIYKIFKQVDDDRYIDVTDTLSHATLDSVVEIINQHEYIT